MKTLTCCFLALFASLATSPSDDFTFDEFERLHSEIVPESPAWKTIPWHAELLSAQNEAAEKKKLIFIWAMDGHPLGCT